MSKEKQVFALYLGSRAIEPEKNGNAGHAQLGVVEIKENGDIRNPEVGHSFNDLVFRCQWNERMGEPYAFDVEYDTGMIVLQEAERMVRLLRKARQVEKKFPVHPTTFGQWCALMGRGLGITKLVKKVSGTGLSFSENEHRTFSIGEAQHVIDAAILDVRQERAVLV
jgi:hypothetical protein